MFQSPMFVQYFKVLKATHILMAPGQTHCHQIKFSPNKLLQGETYKNNNANRKGLTCYQIMVIQGCPVDNNAAIVSTSHCKVDYVSRKVYRFKTILYDCSKNTMNVDTGAGITESNV